MGSQWLEFKGALDNVKPEKEFSTAPLKKEEVLEMEENEEEKMNKDQLNEMLNRKLEEMFDRIKRNAGQIKKKSKMNSVVYDTQQGKIYFSFENCSKLFMYCTTKDELTGFIYNNCTFLYVF